MTTSPRIADTAIALTFDTVTSVQHAASDVSLAIADTYRLKPIVFWSAIGAIVLAAVAAVAVSRR